MIVEPVECDDCDKGVIMPDAAPVFRLNVWSRKHPGQEPLRAVITSGTCSNCHKQNVLIDAWGRNPEQVAAWEQLPWFHGGPNLNPHPVPK